MTTIAQHRFQLLSAEFAECMEHMHDMRLSEEEQRARINLVTDMLTTLEEINIKVDLGEHAVADFINQALQD